MFSMVSKLSWNVARVGSSAPSNMEGISMRGMKGVRYFLHERRGMTFVSVLYRLLRP